MLATFDQVIAPPTTTRPRLQPRGWRDEGSLTLNDAGILFRYVADGDGELVRLGPIESADVDAGERASYAALLDFWRGA